MHFTGQNSIVWIYGDNRHKTAIDINLGIGIITIMRLVIYHVVHGSVRVRHDW